MPSHPAAAALRLAGAEIREAWAHTAAWEEHYARARKLLDNALAVVPDDTALLTCLGAVLSDTGHHAEAEHALERALELGSADANTCYNLAVARVNLRRGARRLFARAARLEKSPLTWEAYFDPHGH